MLACVSVYGEWAKVRERKGRESELWLSAIDCVAKSHVHLSPLVVHIAVANRTVTFTAL